MKRLSMVAAGLLSVSLLSGCIVVVDGDKRVKRDRTSTEQREEDNRAAIARLELGSSPRAVLDTMGTPDFDERISADGVEYRVLYYRTHRVKGDGITTKDECTPLVFANGALLGWGESKLGVIQAQ